MLAIHQKKHFLNFTFELPPDLSGGYKFAPKEGFSQIIIIQ